MKKFIAVLMITAMLFSVITGCKNKPEREETTTIASTTEETTTEITTESQTEITEIPTTEEATTEIIDEGTIVINKGKYNLKFEKSNFENNFSGKILDEISEVIPIEFGLTFGCNDYDNWDGTPNDVLNDIYHSMGCWRIESYDYNTDELKSAVEELNTNPYGHENREGFFTSVEKINSFLRNVYGPNARVFKAEDFDTYDEIKTSEESIFYNYDYSFRFAYLPESEIVCCFARETWGGETNDICICDIRMSNGDYIVEVVSDTYYIYCVKYTMTMSRESNGNIYLKSVDDFYIFPDGVENNFKVTSKNADVKLKKYSSGDWVVVDTLSIGDEVYSSGNINYDGDYMWIVTEEYRGRIKKEYLSPIE